MKKTTLIILFSIAIVIIWFVYSVMHAPLYDMGTRGTNSNWLVADHEKNNKKCNITVSDSTGIEIYAGTTDLQHWVKKAYSISGDTIIINGNITELKPYINTNKLLITGNRLYFHLDTPGHYDTSYAAHIWLNRLKSR